MAIIALLIFRSFKLIEWVRLLFGFATPYYILFGFLYINNQSHLIPQIFHWDVEWVVPKVQNQYIIIAACALLLFVIAGSYYLQKFMERMVIHTKRFWWVVLLYFGFSVLILPLSLTNDWSNALLLAPSLSLCINNIWLAHRKKWIPNLMLAILICVVIALQWRIF